MKGGILVTFIVPALFFASRWVNERSSLSITDDAFVEAHLVNVAPEMVSGRIVRFLAEENDLVGRGQVIAELDAVPYLDRVRLAQAKLDAARADELVSAREERLFRHIAANGRERRKLVERV